MPETSEKQLEEDVPVRALGAFKLVERALLIATAFMTLAAAGIELGNVIMMRTVTLADILLMFLYLEVIGMVAAFYRGTGGSPFIYPIFIAITALARLIVLQGKDMAPENIVFEAGAILLLSVAALVVLQAGRDQK
ncbi:MAG: phosphate-starvation-inducible PsiE family protein [Pseudomonadota bacterium]